MLMMWRILGFWCDGFCRMLHVSRTLSSQNIYSSAGRSTATMFSAVFTNPLQVLVVKHALFAVPDIDTAG